MDPGDYSWAGSIASRMFGLEDGTVSSLGKRSLNAGARVFANKICSSGVPVLPQSFSTLNPSDTFGGFLRMQSGPTQPDSNSTGPYIHSGGS